MIFQKYIEIISRMPQTQHDVSIYPISDYNLEGLKILIDNCVKTGTQNNNNVEIATVNPSLWLGQFLDKYWNKISYVSKLPNFDILKIENDEIIRKTYITETSSFSNDYDIDEFFNKNKFKKLVIYYITKSVNLLNMQTLYTIRYSDITEKYEEREIKINSLFEADNSNI
mgnify:CR=1 FL=1